MAIEFQNSANQQSYSKTNKEKISLNSFNSQIRKRSTINIRKCERSARPFNLQLIGVLISIDAPDQQRAVTINDNLIVPIIEMKQPNNSPIKSQKPQTITAKVNHPKLANIHFKVTSSNTFQQLSDQISSTTLLQLFANYRLQLCGKSPNPDKELSQLVQPPSSTLELDVFFEHYIHSTAMHHYKQVAKVLSRPYQLSYLLRADHSCEREQIDSQKLGTELLDHAFKVGKSSIEDIVSPNYEGQFWNSNTPSTQLLHFIALSGFAPPAQAELAGDFFYLHARTLQNNDLHITACALGFYLNQNKPNSYNPSAIPGKPVYTSLLDLLCNCSQRFSIVFAKLADYNELALLDRLLVKQDTAMVILGSEQSSWLQKYQHQPQWNVRKEATVRDIELPISSSIDWNEMFLQIERRAEAKRSEPNFDSCSWESESLRKAYLSFERAAREGARKIVQGRLQAMNHADEKKRHIYVYDRIFFSLTQDTLLNHAFQKGDDMVPTGTSANTDLVNLSQLIRIRPPGLHLLHTILVFYRGHRIIAQTILPGLLSTELSVLTQYGSVDENKSIHNNPGFHKLLLPICRKLGLQECVFAVDKHEKAVQVAISPQIKGIRSSNGQLYICDLQRISPRDLNYPGLQNEGCVLRQELIQQYIHQKQIQPYNLINPNLETSIKFMQNTKTAQQEQTLKAIAAYLKEDVLPRLANTLKSKSGGDYLTDSQGLSQAFHAHGVNMRYLGELQKHELLSDSIEVRTCLIRGILVRSLKNIFRNALRRISPLLLSATVAQMLNCLFSRRSQLAQLAGSESEEKQEISEPKRKKKKKQREEQAKNIASEEHHIKIENSHYHNIKPQDLWKQVCEVAKARYDYTFQPTVQLFSESGIFRLVYQKYSTLRDLCQCIGLVLEKKDYKLKESDHEQALPFCSKNIIGFTAKTKKPPLFTAQIKQTVALADKFFLQSNFSQSLKTYQEAVSLMRVRRQGEQLSNCLGQISRIHYMLGRLRQALNIEGSNLAFILKAYRQDSFQAVRCYSRLGLYCMSLGVWQSSLWLLSKGLHLMLMCFGQTHPDILVNLANIARVYQLNREIQLASGCYLKAIELLAVIHKNRSHINASFCFSSLASLYYETGEYRKSVEYQTQTVSILLKTLPHDDPRNIDAQKILKVYKEICQGQPGRAGEHRERKK